MKCAFYCNLKICMFLYTDFIPMRRPNSSLLKSNKIHCSLFIVHTVGVNPSRQISLVFNTGTAELGINLAHTEPGVSELLLMVLGDTVSHASVSHERF